MEGSEATKWLIPKSMGIQIPWLIGFCLSILGLIVQMILYILVPRSRKMDQKLLTQLTVARILRIAFEYHVTLVYLEKSIVRDVMLTLYLQTDAALICWMFLFTKNLYVKVIHTSNIKTSFGMMSVMIWVATIPIGILSPTLMHIHSDYFVLFYRIFAGVKFAVLSINLFCVGRIFSVAFNKPDRRVSVLKTCVVSFLLSTITGAQAQCDICVTDVLTPWVDGRLQPQITMLFGVINSYQVIAITIIFVLLVNNACEKQLVKTLTKRLLKEPV